MHVFALPRRMAAALVAALVLVGAAVASRPAHAQSYTWLANTTGTITTASNWVSGSAGAIAGSNNTMNGTQSLIPSGTAILGSSHVSTGTMTIAAGAVIAVGATSGDQNLLPFSLINYGTLRNATAARLVLTNTNSPIVNAGVFEISGGGSLRLYATLGTISNTNGLISVTSGTLTMDRSGYTINGGTMSIGVGGSQVTSVASTDFKLNNMTISNSGTIEASRSNVATGTRLFTYELGGTGTFANSGVVNVLFGALSGAISGNNTLSMRFSSGQTVTNTGTINISSLYSVATGTAPVFVSGSSSFTNQGRINIITSTSSVDTAQLRWSTALGNSGTMAVDGPNSSIQLGSQTFTQSGATSALSLINGGRIVAGSVVINSGTLLGTGTVSAPATIGGIVAPGDGGIGTLSMGGNVTWNAGNNWRFDLGTAAASLALASTGSSTQDLLSITGNFTKGTGSTFTFDFLQTGTAGWYRLADWSASTTFAAGDFAATNLPSGNTANFTVDGTTSALYVEIVSAVPEPESLTLAGIGVAASGLLARRRLKVRRRAA